MSGQIAILEATRHLMKTDRVGSVTIDRVAARAKVAKGLIHYHFGTKENLLCRAVEGIFEERATEWTAAMGTEELALAVDRTWQLLVREHQEGTLRAVLSLGSRPGGLTDQTVTFQVERFRNLIVRLTTDLLRRNSVRPQIPQAEIGAVVTLLVEGAGNHLVAGLPMSEVASAYSAGWLCVFSLAPGA